MSPPRRRIPRAVRVSNTRLLADDFATTYRFYHDLLGLPTLVGDARGPYAELGRRSSFVGIFPRSLLESAVGGGRGGSGPAPDVLEIVLEVPDVDRTYQDLVARGTVFVAPPTDRPLWGLRTAHLRDPDGRLVELFTRMPARSAPHPRPARRR